MADGPFLSVVIPVFEGEDIIRGTVEAVKAHASKRGWPIEIVVGFSEGRDGTRRVLAELAGEHSEMRIVDTTAQFGKGGAVRGAMAETRGRARCFIDADNGASFDQVDRGLELLEEHDIAVGSRYVEGGSAGRRTLGRSFLSRGGNLLIRVALGLRGTDTRAPLKVYRGDVADRLFPLLRLNGFGFDSELLFLARKLGYRTVEFPVRWESGERTSVRVPRDAIRSIAELFQIRWHWLVGSYGRRGGQTTAQQERTSGGR
ncbi:MAG TPA: glycosyltransferase [Gaiellaceae bacterium]|nr:glycosyltransferase [Gaiellaceae bacterium]